MGREDIAGTRGGKTAALPIFRGRVASRDNPHVDHIECGQVFAKPLPFLLGMKYAKDCIHDCHLNLVFYLFFFFAGRSFLKIYTPDLVGRH